MNTQKTALEAVLDSLARLTARFRELGEDIIETLENIGMIMETRIRTMEEERDKVKAMKEAQQ